MKPEELARVELPAEPASVRRARRFVADVLDGKVEGDLLDASLVVTSELATNAVLHAQTTFEVVVRSDETGLRLEVHDGNPRLPRRKRYSEQSGTGRGLVLVESLATVAGAERTEDGGKVVWAVLSELPPAPPMVGASGDRSGDVPAPVAILSRAADAPPGDDGLRVAAVEDDPETLSRSYDARTLVPA